MVPDDEKLSFFEPSLEASGDGCCWTVGWYGAEMIGLTKLSLFRQSLGFTSSPFVVLLQGYVQVLILFWKQGGSQDASF